MTEPAELTAQQHAYWNGPATRTWVGRQQQMDRALAPVLKALMGHAAPRPGERVLDIGCGTGQSALALAEAVGAEGRVTGVDVSAPMIEIARGRVPAGGNVDFLLGDAASHTFDSEKADLAFSRFGLMFFGDPVAAFVNLRRAMKPSGRLVFACWQAQAANPWMQVPQGVVTPLLPPILPTDPHLPGQFAFGDANRVSGILKEAGFAPPAFTPFAFPMLLGDTLEEAALSSSGFGATGRMLAEQPDGVREAALAALRHVLAPHRGADGTVTMTGRVWLVTAGRD